MIRVIVVVAAYIAAQMLADISSLKIVLFAGMSMDAGTLVYPITFTLRDLVHKTVGRKGARVTVISAAVINLFMAGLFWVVSVLPYDPSTGLQADWNSVLAPVWRIVMASILAEVLAELTDTEVYHWWVTKVTKKHQWARVLLSNAISVPLDSLLFCWVAFGGTMPNDVVWAIFWSNVILKGIVTVVSMPLIYVMPEKAAEKV